MARCFDCLTEWAAGHERFVVLKQMRDMPADTDPIDARQLKWLLFDPVCVCGECAGWYGEDAVRLSPDE